MHIISHHSISFRIEVSPSKERVNTTSVNNITPIGSFKGTLKWLGTDPQTDQVALFGERRSYPILATRNMKHLFQSSAKLQGGLHKFSTAKTAASM